MNISAWSIRNPVPAVLLFILLSVLGLLGFSRLDVQNFPDMDVPTITVSATLDGAAPAQLETEVARKIEDKLASLTLLDHISTTITDGSVSISASFSLDKNGEAALNEVRNAVDQARADLPSSMAEPSVSKSTAAGSSLLTYTVAAPRMDDVDLSWFIDNDVAKALLSVRGVAKVERVGGVDREVLITLDPALMAGLNVTPSDVSSALKSAQQDASGGRGEIGGLRQSARVLAAVGSVEELSRLSIPLGGGQIVRLDQVARITDGAAERTTLAYRDGQAVVGFQVTRSKGFSDVGVADAVRTAVAAFGRAHPDVAIAEASNTVTPIVESYHGSLHLLIEGAVLAVVVVFCFLRDWRATAISATALPLSILPTFGVMALCGFSLNTITLLALSLVIGVLVDDAIVEIENIARHIADGKPPYQAAMEAADEIGLAVIATTFTMVAVFLPTAFMAGIPGLIFRQFGITSSVAVLASLLVARLLTPMMAAYLLRPAADHSGAPDGGLMRRYLAAVRACLRRRPRVMLGTALFMALSLALIPLLPTGFFPASDNAQTSITVELAPGATLRQTRDASLQAAALLKRIPEVRSVFSSVGTASSGQGMDTSSTAEVRSATLTVDLAPLAERRLSQSAVEAKMRTLLRQVAGARIAVGGGGNGEKLQITLASDDSGALQRAADALETQLRGLHGIGAVSSSAALQRPEIIVRPDPARAAALGVSAEAIADAVRIGTYGDYSTAMPKLNLPQRQLYIRVRMDDAVRGDVDRIGQLRVAGANGSVALASVASLEIGSGPSEIDRIDRLRNVTLSVELAGRALGDVQREAARLPALRQLPAGVRNIEQGELQHMSELFSSFGIAMAVGVFCIYAVLVLLFHDFLQPATILCALPLSLGGAMFALLVTHSSFSMPSVIGLLMLMGIVTKNSILLVEYAIVARRERGMGRFDALLDACHKRARPILMTTIAMGAGMLPNALGLGVDASFRQPMAIVVIGGLLTSTVLSLLVVPVVFTYVDDFLGWLRRAVRRGKGVAGDAAAAA
jgi:multidrug efflux pump subunit AcrB